MSGNNPRDYERRRRDTAREMSRRLLLHVRDGTTDSALAALENGCSVYTDPQRASRERELLFFQRPLVVGFSRELGSPGDCLVFDELQLSVIVVRGEDGVLRAFRNMCTHRGSKLLLADGKTKCQRLKGLTCPFHGWSYDLQGRLKSVPGKTGFNGIDLAERNLKPVAVAELYGLVFVQIEGASGCPDITDYLGPFGPEIAQLELGGLSLVRHVRVTASCNWKLVLDTFCEAYHFGVLHSSTIGKTHYSNIAVFDQFMPHWRMGFAERVLGELVGRADSVAREPRFNGVHFIFPNVIIVVGELETGELCVRLFRIFPHERVGEMSCQISVYASPSLAEDPRRVEREFAQDDAESEITKEDFAIAVEAYRNLLQAPSDFKLVYGRNEPALQAFHRAVAQVIGEEL